MKNCGKALWAKVLLIIGRRLKESESILVTAPSATSRVDPLIYFLSIFLFTWITTHSFSLFLLSLTIISCSNIFISSQTRTIHSHSQFTIESKRTDGN